MYEKCGIRDNDNIQDCVYRNVSFLLILTEGIVASETPSCL